MNLLDVDKGKSSGRKPPSSRASGSKCMPPRTSQLSLLSIHVSVLYTAAEDSPCPICNKTVPINTINQHIDSGCTKYCVTNTKSKQKQDWGKVFSGGDAGTSKSKGKLR